jgi:dCMP deaminase
MNQETGDKRFMGLAHHVAGWSKERGRLVGAVIVGPDDEVRSTGYNGFPRGVDDNVDSRHEKSNGEKYYWSCHAESNAIFNAARVGIPLKGCRIYVPWFPCVECGKAIIQSGITEVVAYQPDLNDERWGRDFERTLQMFAESRVQVRYMEKLMDLQSGSVIAVT